MKTVLSLLLLGAVIASGIARAGLIVAEEYSNPVVWSVEPVVEYNYHNYEIAIFSNVRTFVESSVHSYVSVSVTHGHEPYHEYPVSEPGILLLFGAGILGLALIQLKRKTV